jgi:LysR family transcriptional regulator for bpeEF and oprC
MELLQSMQVFVHVARLGSFTKAADATQLGRPQITRAVQQLEASLGVRLFQRTTRKVRLTTEGEQYYQRVMGILDSVAETAAMFVQSGTSLRGKLRIDIPSAFAQPAFMTRLRHFADSHPAIEVALGVTDRAVDLVAEGVDCVLRIGDLPDSSLVARRIGMATMVTCAAPSYLDTHGAPSTPDQLDTHRGVSFLSGQNHRPLAWQFLQDGQDKSYLSRHGITVNESNAYVQCGVAGFGILQAPGITLDRYLADGSLVEVLEDYRPRPRSVSVLYPSKSRLAPQVEAFVEWLGEGFAAAYARWLE